MKMSKYTTELRYICDNYTRDTVESWFMNYDLNDYLTSSQIEVIENAGLFSKQKLASSIVDAYYFREIGLETPTLFKHFAKVKMRAIMETKLPLIYSTSLEYNPLINVDYTESFNRTIDRDGTSQNTSSGTTENNTSGLAVNSDTPQGQLSKESILQGAYASQTSAGENTQTSTDTINTNGSTKQNDVETSTKQVKGNSGISVTNQKLIEQYRAVIVSVTGDIIKELSSLFMGIY